MSKILEIACFSPEAAFAAQLAGAHRIELCENYCVGGISPSPEAVKNVKSFCSIPVHVIIRPREGDFVYNRNEIEKMKSEISFCQDHGVNGVVFGILTKENEVNVKACSELIKIANGLPVTFHRAFDHCENPEQALETLCDMGVSRVLTSGGKENAAKGANTIAQLQRRAGKRITLMPGGGIRASNLKSIADKTGCSEFHSAALVIGSEIPAAKEINSMLEILGAT